MALCWWWGRTSGRRGVQIHSMVKLLRFRLLSHVIVIQEIKYVLNVSSDCFQLNFAVKELFELIQALSIHQMISSLSFVAVTIIMSLHISHSLSSRRFREANFSEVKLWRKKIQRKFSPKIIDWVSRSFYNFQVFLTSLKFILGI